MLNFHFLILLGLSLLRPYLKLLTKLILKSSHRSTICDDSAGDRHFKNKDYSTFLHKEMCHIENYIMGHIDMMALYQ